MLCSANLQDRAVFAMCSLKVSWSSKITPRFLTDNNNIIIILTYDFNFTTFERQILYFSLHYISFKVLFLFFIVEFSGIISTYFSGNSSSQDCKALQRVVRLAERISGSALPSLQDIYLKRCRSRAVKIIKDSNHPGNCLFTLLPSGKRFRSLMAKTERLRRSFFPQAIRLLNSNSAS